MFGESDSESPRVPSPWDSIISTPSSVSPSTGPLPSSSPLAKEVIPKLVPESDDGNVEYKLQLLSPSPARFARLVTQLKWRLLEGGGQAYYELGVADSGALVGLTRTEMEQTLETLEMMAGEIGASVIVVKEIEVPAALADLGVPQDDHRRVKRKDEFLDSSGGDTSTATEAETTEIDTDNSTTDEDDEGEKRGHDRSGSASTSDLTSSSSVSVFIMDPEEDPAENADGEAEVSTSPPQYIIDLEISSVFKPRPTKARFPHHLYANEHSRRQKGQKKKKLAGLNDNHSLSTEQQPTKSQNRRQVRDRQREEKRKVLLDLAESTLPSVSTAVPEGLKEEDATNTRQSTLKAPVLGLEETDALVSGLEGLHVPLEEQSIIRGITADDSIPPLSLTAEPDEEEADDVFPTPSMPHASFTSADSGGGSADVLTPPRRLIVEALVVRKMSIEEGFLDFGGFAMI